ncbi:MAG: hypothetical protein EBQ95_01340 [Gammaproteobacteria bacterium]|nr:hypothetical protein [Gammaproteobacteria bacterium]
MFTNASFAAPLNQELKDIEEQLEKNHQQLLIAQAQQKQNIIELNDAKQQLKITPFAPTKKASLFELDYTRYPKNIYPNLFQITATQVPIELDFHAWIQADNDVFFNTQGLFINDGQDVNSVYNKSTVDRYWLRRVRPTIEGKAYSFIQYFINMDFGEGHVGLYDAFVDINYFRALGVQVGQQMSLVSGIENYFDNFDYLARAYTMEMSPTAMLAPDRQIGVTLHGTFGPSGKEPYYRGLTNFGFDDMLSYQLGFYNGVPDNTQVANYSSINTPYPFPNAGFTSNPSNSANKAFAGRVFVNPFIQKEGHFLQHLGFGFAGSTENPNLQLNIPDLYSIGQNPIFSYSTYPEGASYYQVSANGSRARLHPQALWSFGSLGIIADYTQTLQTLQPVQILITLQKISDKKITPINRAQQIQFIYNLTQEEFNLFHLIPNHNFKVFEKGAYGAFQLVFRVSQLKIDPNNFNDYINYNDSTYYLFADPRISVQQANSWSLGINWFWNQFLRISMEYDYTSFTGGCSTGGLSSTTTPGCLTGGSNIFLNSSTVLNRPAEKIFMQRLQLTF